MGDNWDTAACVDKSDNTVVLRLNDYGIKHLHGKKDYLQPPTEDVVQFDTLIDTYSRECTTYEASGNVKEY